MRCAVGLDGGHAGGLDDEKMRELGVGMELNELRHEEAESM